MHSLKEVSLHLAIQGCLSFNVYRLVTYTFFSRRRLFRKISSSHWRSCKQDIFQTLLQPLLPCKVCIWMYIVHQTYLHSKKQMLDLCLCIEQVIYFMLCFTHSMVGSTWTLPLVQQVANIKKRPHYFMNVAQI